MEYRLAAKVECDAIYQLVQETIQTIYPKYYPKEVVDFFCNHHSLNAIKEDIKAGNVNILFVDGEIVGTGCFVNNHITRVYVLPKHQGKRYGTFIMNQLEKSIHRNYNKAILDASLPAARLYEKLNYKTVQHEKYPVENGVILAYEVMEKELHTVNTAFSYDGKQFSPKSNSENGEVDGETIFNYHQDEAILWAEYQGGDIVRGFLVGTVSESGELDFVYQHINTEKMLRIGKCHSVHRKLEDGKIELSEEWQWMNGDCSKGSSVLVEI